MWKAFTSMILSTLIPASVLSTQSLTPPTPTPPPLDIQVEPLAVSVEEELSTPFIRSNAALVIETHSNEALYTKNVWEALPIASLTKLMTALVVKENMDLEQVVTVSKKIYTVGGSSMDLVVGEQITVDNLLKGLLINSGNDAAVVLSEAAAGSTEEFVKLMNERKNSLGLDATVFVDPAGLKNGNVSSAFEIAHLAKYVFKDPYLQSIMREKNIVVQSVDGIYNHRLSNTNRLLGTDMTSRIIAGKTGTTPLAGQCLISFINNDSGRTTLTILLGSPNRYEEVKTLTSWVDENFIWE